MKHHSIHTQSPTDGLHPVQLFIPIPATLLLATTTSLLTKHPPERTPPASPFSKTASCKKRTSCFVLKLQIDVGPSAVSLKQPGKRGGEERGYSALRAHKGRGGCTITVGQRRVCARGLAGVHSRTTVAPLTAPPSPASPPEAPEPGCQPTHPRAPCSNSPGWAWDRQYPSMVAMEEAGKEKVVPRTSFGSPNSCPILNKWHDPAELLHATPAATHRAGLGDASPRVLMQEERPSTTIAC